jgi:hypothetical protein
VHHNFTKYKKDAHIFLWFPNVRGCERCVQVPRLVGIPAKANDMGMGMFIFCDPFVVIIQKLMQHPAHTPLLELTDIKHWTSKCAAHEHNLLSS